MYINSISFRPYTRFIDKCKLKTVSAKWHHKHHIVPRCCGGGNENNNIVRLSLRDHVQAHKLLAELMTDNIDKDLSSKLKYAYGKMKGLRHKKNNFTKKEKFLTRKKTKPKDKELIKLTNEVTSLKADLKRKSELLKEKNSRIFDLELRMAAIIYEKEMHHD